MNRKLTRHAAGGLFLIACLTAGCSTTQSAPPLTAALVGLTYTPDSAGLQQMLRETDAAAESDQIGKLRTFADGNVEPTAKQKANYVYARLLQKQSSRADYEEAIQRYRTAAQLPALFERSQLHISECAGMLGDERLVQEALQAIASYEKVSAKSKLAALYALGQSHLRAGNKDKAREYFALVTKLDPQSQYALGSTYYLAQLKMSADDTATAGTTTTAAVTTTTELSTEVIEQLRHYLQLSPDGRFADDIMRQLQGSPRFSATAADHAAFARVHYARGRWQEALSEWRLSATSSDWFQQGIAHLRLGRKPQAKALLTAGIKSHPNDDAVEDAATLLSRMTDKKGAIEVWRTVLNHSTRFGDLALYNLAIRAPSHTDALPFYRQLISKYPQSNYASEATWWLAWQEIQAGKSANALPILERGAQHYPETRAGARFPYWIGKIHERAGRKTEAKAAYQRTISVRPWDYYAYRAQQRLKVLSGGTDEGWRTKPHRKVVGAPAHWVWPDAPPSYARPYGDQVAVLTELRQWDETLELVPPAEDKNGLRGFILAKAGLPLPAINAAAKHLSGTPTREELWQVAYPLLHSELISNEAPGKGVDAFLVQALIREESRYDHRAVSSSNALGLMQLLPGTAYGVAKRLGIKLGSRDDIHDPNNNIRMGTDYLAYVQQRHKGNSLFAVASYNGGPNAVARWAQHMPADTDVFVENIPYKETRDYVRKVFGSYWNYRSIYGES